MLDRTVGRSEANQNLTSDRTAVLFRDGLAQSDDSGKRCTDALLLDRALREWLGDRRGVRWIFIPGGVPRKNRCAAAHFPFAPATQLFGKQGSKSRLPVPHGFVDRSWEANRNSHLAIFISLTLTSDTFLPSCKTKRTGSEAPSMASTVLRANLYHPIFRGMLRDSAERSASHLDVQDAC